MKSLLFIHRCTYGNAFCGIVQTMDLPLRIITAHVEPAVAMHDNLDINPLIFSIFYRLNLIWSQFWLWCKRKKHWQWETITMPNCIPPVEAVTRPAASWLEPGRTSLGKFCAELPLPWVLAIEKDSCNIPWGIGKGSEIWQLSNTALSSVFLLWCVQLGGNSYRQNIFTMLCKNITIVECIPITKKCQQFHITRAASFWILKQCGKYPKNVEKRT